MQKKYYLIIKKNNKMENVKLSGLALKTAINRAGQVLPDTWEFKHKGKCHLSLSLYIYI